MPTNLRKNTLQQIKNIYKIYENSKNMTPSVEPFFLNVDIDGWYRVQTLVNLKIT